MFDVIIKNGLVADGITDSLISADVAINSDRIAVVEPNIDPDRGKKIIEAKGMIVAPGFVDVHSHSDYYLIIDQRAESKLMQGVTTEVGGNCGYAAAPMSGNLLERRVRDYQHQFGIDVKWTDLESYFNELKNHGLAVNFAALLGYNTIRGSVIGENSHQPDKKSMDALCKMTACGLSQGAVGMSLGVVYPPACFAKESEFIKVFKEVAKQDKVLTAHIRSEGAKLLEALTEIVNVAKGSGSKLQISHLKTAGKENWSKLDAALEILESGMEDGLEIMADRYPYIASNTGLQVVLPDCAFTGGRDQLMADLLDKNKRKEFKEKILQAHPDPEYWNTVMISQVVTQNNLDVEGLSVSQGADARGKDVFDFTFDLLIEEKSNVEAIFFCMNEKNLERILLKPWVSIGSDSGARAIDGPLAMGRPHPRTFGTFPRFFAEFVRRKKLFTIPEAVRKTSYNPAKFFGISKRGRITPDWYADIVIFNLNTVEDTSTYLKPFSYPTGIEHVFVNGIQAISHGKPTGSKSGSIITN